MTQPSRPRRPPPSTRPLGEDGHLRADVDARLVIRLRLPVLVDALVADTDANDPVAFDEHARRGELGEDVTVLVERGERQFAAGDRVMFLRNERSLGVKNGLLGRIESVSSSRMAVTLETNERTLDYGKTIDPLKAREFFISLMTLP